ncbi:MAG: hypothetical protein Q7S31_04075 [bacterium]|nr:hypothetical protein [bacterium]
MNKAVLAVIAVVILVGLGAYFVINKGKSSSGPTGSTANEQATTGAQSLKELLMGGVAQKCTFDSAGSQGTVYVGSGKMRGDFTSATGGQTVQSHMLVDGNTSYIWMEGQKTGFKTTLDASADASADAQTNTTQSQINVDEKLDYNCAPGGVNSTMFDLPAGVQFSDMSSMMDAGNDTGADKCAACDSVPASAKSQCLAALGCN